MAFYPKQFCNKDNPTMYLDDTCLRWVSSHKYLGVMISNDCKDELDIQRQIKSYYTKGNMIIRKFRKCSEPVKIQLFKTYFSNVYAGHLWRNYSVACYKKATVAYNNIYCMFLNLKRDCSMTNKYVEHNVHSFNSLLRIYMASFIDRLSKSENMIVNTICDSVYFMYQSKIFKLWIDKAYAL